MIGIPGLNAYQAYSAVCLKEGRFRRVKHRTGLLADAMRYCLEEARIGLASIDYITTNCNPKADLLKKSALQRLQATESRFDYVAGSRMRIPVKATGESSRRRPPNPVEGDQFWVEPLDACLMFIGKVAYLDFGIKSAA